MSAQTLYGVHFEQHDDRTGTPDQIVERVSAFEAVGVDLLLLQCSPQLEEMEQFSEAVIRVKA